MLCVGIQLYAVGIRVSQHMAGIFYNGHLHTQTDAKEGNLLFSCILDGCDLSFRAACAKASGDKDTVDAPKLLGYIFRCQLFGINPSKLYIRTRCDSAVLESLRHA